MGDLQTFNVWFEGELHVHTRIRDVLINVTDKQRFSHLPVILPTNTYVQVVTVMVIVTGAPVASTTVFCVAIRTTKEHVKHQ